MKTLLLIAVFCATSVWAASPPNIVYILADDMGIGDASGLNPQSAWQTPNIDRLAREGRVFTDAHSSSSVCSPSRYSLLTGRHSWRGPLKQGVLHGPDPALIEPDRLTVPGLLRAHGYATAMIGKWHLGLDWAHAGPGPEAIDYSRPFGGGPTDHGFDEFFGITASLDMPAYCYLENDRVVALPTGTVAENSRPRMWRGGPISPDFRHEEVLDRLTDRAVAYLNRRGGRPAAQPFFLYFALTAPHFPISPTKEFEGKSHTNLYGDFMLQVDAAVGRVLAALDAAGLAENTLVIFTADNGCAGAANLRELARFHHDPSAGLRGFKGDIYEGGHRIPFVARWPGQTPAGSRSDATVGQLDLLATCAELLGATLPATAGEDSVSMLGLLRGAPAAAGPREALVHHSGNGSFAIRSGEWKLCLCADPDSRGAGQPRDTYLPGYQLFNLASDPAEKNDVAAARPEVVQRLGRLMRITIERGRSTPGAPQPYVNPPDWAQIAWLGDFAP